ncbi:unnamed protein product [Macrosiphum euphorbiae]|uniref:Uncharacterized protein n=1 Tax=Macrosiphum euphorbiae TaxID=13131 RepID=A0AAV0WAV4_9HEMI|nr:unnamed protein product [Macrosiphum euphorbiae]
MRSDEWWGAAARFRGARRPSRVFIWLPSVAARTFNIFVAGPCSVLLLLPSLLLPPIAPALCLSLQNCVTGWAEVPHHCIVISACVGRLAGSVGRPRWSGEQAQHSTGLQERSVILSSARVSQSLLYFPSIPNIIIAASFARESPSLAVLRPAPGPGHRPGRVLEHVQERKTHDVRVGHHTEQGGSSPLGQR